MNNKELLKNTNFRNNQNYVITKNIIERGYNVLPSLIKISFNGNSEMPESRMVGGRFVSTIEDTYIFYSNKTLSYIKLKKNNNFINFSYLIVLISVIYPIYMIFKIMTLFLGIFILLIVFIFSIMLYQISLDKKKKLRENIKLYRDKNEIKIFYINGDNFI